MGEQTGLNYVDLQANIHYETFSQSVADQYVT